MMFGCVSLAPRGSQSFVIYWAIMALHTISHAGKRHCDLISLGERGMGGLLSNEGGLMDGEVREVLIQANLLFST